MSLGSHKSVLIIVGSIYISVLADTKLWKTSQFWQPYKIKLKIEESLAELPKT